MGWQLTFEDTFSNGSLPDPSKWYVSNKIESGHERKLHVHTNRSKNVRLEGGNLVLEAHREPWSYTGTKKTYHKQYTSGWVSTRGRFSQTYGAWECKSRFGKALGTWPAFWLIPDVGKWPHGGEIDIYEFVKSAVHMTTHFVRRTKGKSTKNFWVDRHWLDDWHTYRLEWAPEGMRWLVDGKEKHSMDEFNGWPFNKPFYIIFNFDIGGWGGSPASTIFPRRHEIDYVRVYKESTSGYEPDPTPTPTPSNPNKDKLDKIVTLANEVKGAI